MRKDKDGFTDITWCGAAALADWDNLREVFQEANARKAISPTQFNHQSTRGHCIMTLELEKPHPTMEGMKQKGRVYVCDLAGTEPAEKSYTQSTRQSNMMMALSITATWVRMTIPKRRRSCEIREKRLIFP